MKVYLIYNFLEIYKDGENHRVPYDIPEVYKVLVKKGKVKLLKKIGSKSSIGYVDNFVLEEDGIYGNVSFKVKRIDKYINEIEGNGRLFFTGTGTFIKNPNEEGSYLIVDVKPLYFHVYRELQ